MNYTRSFLTLPRPVVCCITGEPTVKQDIAMIKNGEYDGAAAFAVHMEYLGHGNHMDESMSALAKCTRKPIMLLHYRSDGKYTDEERMDILRRAIQCGATAIDLTADTYKPSPLEFTDDPKAVDLQKAYIDSIHALGGEVIMSSHIAEYRTCEQVLEHMKSVESRGVDIAKIVTKADTDAEFVDGVRTTLALRREMKIPFIHLLSGTFAAPHRFLSPTLGNFLTFCVHTYSENFTTLQPPVASMNAVLDNINWNINEIASLDF